MSKPSWAQLVRQVHERAGNCCEYCQTCQKIIGQSMHVEHIDPDGGDDFNNLCLSCPSCNFSKAKATSGIDPETGENVTLFNPRLQLWTDHFAWTAEGSLIVGKTAVGRATIVRLKMNIDRIVTARKIWVKVGEHPPEKN